jgi:hypothetical protein
MSNVLKEISLLEELNSLPAKMQKIYLQIISSVDYSFTRLRACGAAPEPLSDEFIDELLDQLLAQPLSRQALEDRINQELHRQILERSEPTAVC